MLAALPKRGRRLFFRGVIGLSPNVKFFQSVCQEQIENLGDFWEVSVRRLVLCTSRIFH